MIHVPRIIAGLFLTIAWATHTPAQAAEVASETPPTTEYIETTAPAIEIESPTQEPPPTDETIDAINRERDLLEGEAVTQSNQDSSAPLEDRSRELFRSFLTVVIYLMVGLAAFLAFAKLMQRVLARVGKHSPLLAGPALATLVGRFHLDKQTVLHYVKTGGRVLLLASTPQHVSLVATFDESDFDALNETSTTLVTEKTDSPEKPLDFRAFLEESASRLDERGATTGPLDVDALKQDIQRMQKLMKDVSREPNE